MQQTPDPEPTPSVEAQHKGAPLATVEKQQVEVQVEVGGRGGLEPTRYGDWEKAGRCIDF